MGEGSSDADSRMIFFSVGFETLCLQVFFGFDFNGNDLFAVVYQQINFAVVPVIGVIVKAVVGGCSELLEYILLCDRSLEFFEYLVAVYQNTLAESCHAVQQANVQQKELEGFQVLIRL